jgi:hypothetical protein
MSLPRSHLWYLSHSNKNESLNCAFKRSASVLFPLPLSPAIANMLQQAEASVDSLGAKDLLASLASSREEDLYLLGRRVS